MQVREFSKLGNFETMILHKKHKMTHSPKSSTSPKEMFIVADRVYDSWRSSRKRRTIDIGSKEDACIQKLVVGHYKNCLNLPERAQ